jgi:hypothetical protein
MSGQGLVFGAAVAGAIIAAYSLLNRNRQNHEIASLLAALASGHRDINFILAPNPLVVSKNEKVIAVLPHTTLLEPRSVRVRNGSRTSSSVRWASGFSTGSGDYTSTTESRDQLREIDSGTLIVTDQRVAFLGALKTITIPTQKISGMDRYTDAIAVHCEGKEKVETFRISATLQLTYQGDDNAVSVPFVGPILGFLVSQTMSALGNSNEMIKSRS